MSLAPASLTWFARHELTLQWRDFAAMLTGGSTRRAVAVLIAAGVVTTIMHLIADMVLAIWAKGGITADAATFAQLTGSGLLFAAMSLSQAMESVTRAYYTRADLDLILSSPASARRLFAVRTGAIAVTAMLLTGLLAAPFIDVLVWHDGVRWLAVYPVIAAISLITTALAVLITLALFRIAGPKRTRLIAQILAAIVGAALIVGIQIAVILGSGTTVGAGQVLTTLFMGHLPEAGSPIWLPARAAMGDPLALLAVLGTAIGLTALVIPFSAGSFASRAIAATGVGESHAATVRARPFRPISQAGTLRRKEILLLRRDPWLVSQSLMQLFYLVPPAVLLWMNFGADAAALPIVTAIIVMAAGQLAGGLAWLTISGEDAHDLVISAPLTTRRLYRAKIEAVLAVIAVVTAPLVVGLALANLRIALTTLAFIAAASASAIAIQLMFRVRAKRSQFARRQTASRLATLLEALVSINWAGAAGLTAALPLAGPFAALPALVILLAVWLLRRNATPA